MSFEETASAIAAGHLPIYRAQLDSPEILKIFMEPQCPAPALLGHREPCYCAEEPEFREVHFWGRP